MRAWGLVTLLTTSFCWLLGGASICSSEGPRHVETHSPTHEAGASPAPTRAGALAQTRAEPRAFARTTVAQRPEPEPESPLPRWITHHSIPGDTVELVAIRYGVPALWLRRWNGMSATAQLSRHEPRNLRVKARRLPAPRQPLVHVVSEGETWQTIARRYGVFDTHLRAQNHDEIGYVPESGERVIVWTEPAVIESMHHDGPAPGRAATIAPGANSIGTPQSGRLAAGVQIPPGPGYERRFPNSSWGTTYAVRHLVQTLDEFHETSDYAGTLMLGSMSFRRGGPIGPHVSHQSGRDVDIRLPMHPWVRRIDPARGRNVDWDAAWALIVRFARSGAVEVIFLDYRVQRRIYRRAKSAGVDDELLAQIFQFPEGPWADQGIVRHSKGHEGHIHVRYACGPYEPQCGN